MPLITRICWSVFHKVDTIFCLKPSLSFEYERWLCVSVVDRTNLSAGVLHLRLPFMTQLKRSVLRWINSVKKFYIHSWAFLVCLCVCYNLLMCVCRFLLKGFSRQPLKWDIFARNLFVISQMEDRNKVFCFCSPTLLSGKPSIAVFVIEILSSLSCFCCWSFTRLSMIASSLIRQFLSYGPCLTQTIIMWNCFCSLQTSSFLDKEISCRNYPNIKCVSFRHFKNDKEQTWVQMCWTFLKMFSLQSRNFTRRFIAVFNLF